MNRYKAIIVAPHGSRAYCIFEAESLDDAWAHMKLTWFNLLLQGMIGRIESVEQTEEPVIDGMVVLTAADDSLTVGEMIT